MPAVHKWGRTYSDGEGLRGSFQGYVVADTLAHAATWALSNNATQDVLSNATPINNTGIIGNVPTNPQARPSPATYPSVMQRAQFTFVTATGSLIRVGVPAPKSALFYADGVTINPAQTDVAAFITAMLTPVNTAGLSDKDGNLANAFVGGVLVQTRFRRKITIWRQTPDETGPEE